MNADSPWCTMFCIQNGSVAAAVPLLMGVVQVEPRAAAIWRSEKKAAATRSDLENMVGEVVWVQETDSTL